MVCNLIFVCIQEKKTNYNYETKKIWSKNRRFVCILLVIYHFTYSWLKSYYLSICFVLYYEIYNRANRLLINHQIYTHSKLKPKIDRHQTVWNVERSRKENCMAGFAGEIRRVPQMLYLRLLSFSFISFKCHSMKLQLIRASGVIFVLLLCLYLCRCTVYVSFPVAGKILFYFKKSFYRSLISSTISANTVPQTLKINQEKQPLKLYRFHATLFFRRPYQCQSMLLKANFVVVLFSPAIRHCLVMMSNHDNTIIIVAVTVTANQNFSHRPHLCVRSMQFHLCITPRFISAPYLLVFRYFVEPRECIFDVGHKIAMCRFHKSQGQQCVCFHEDIKHLRIC